MKPEQCFDSCVGLSRSQVHRLSEGRQPDVLESKQCPVEDIEALECCELCAPKAVEGEWSAHTCTLDVIKLQMI